MTPSRLAWIQLSRQPVGSLLAALLLALAVALALVLHALATSATERLGDRDPAVDIVIGGKSSPVLLWSGALQGGPWQIDVLGGNTALTQLAGDVRPRHLMRLARVGTAADAPAFGVDAAWFERPEGVPAPRVIEGRRPAASGEVTIGADVARRGVRVGDRISLASDGQLDERALADEAPLEVVGVLAPFSGGTDRGVYFTIEQAESIYRRAMGAGTLRDESGPLSTHYLLTLPENDASARRELFETFHVRRAEQVVDTRQIEAQLAAWLGVGTQASRALAALLLVLALGWLAALASQRMNQLAQRFGLLRAQGWRASDLAQMAVVENLLLVAAGWLTGGVFAAATLAALARPLADAGLGAAGFPWPWALAVLGTLAAGAALTVLLPLARLRQFRDAGSLQGL